MPRFDISHKVSFILKNILINSAGKRVALVEIFRRAAKELKVDAKVYTADVESKTAPSCRMSGGSFVVPLPTSEDYMQVLQSICLGYNVKLVIPTTERELPILSANKDIFAKLGICIFVPDYDFVMKCIDNHQFDGYLETLGIDISIPHTHIDNYETLVDNVLTRPDFVENVIIGHYATFHS